MMNLLDVIPSFFLGVFFGLGLSVVIDYLAMKKYTKN
jgi:hypothetical protein